MSQSSTDEIDWENLPFWFDGDNQQPGGTDDGEVLPFHEDTDDGEVLPFHEDTDDGEVLPASEEGDGQSLPTHSTESLESLPDTGEANRSIIPAFAALLAGFGLLRRKKKDDEENPESSK